MARLQQEHKEEHLIYLKKLVNTCFTSSLTNAYDCKILEEAIFVSTNHRLSVDTIRRFFGILKCISQPSVFTLDVFSKYVGYKKWSDLIESYNQQNQLHQKTLLFDVIETHIDFDEIAKRINNFSKSSELYETFNQIVLIKYQQNDSPFFKRLFELTSLFEYTEKHKYDIYHSIHLLACLCDKKDWLAEIAVSKYYNLPFEHDYFVEWIVIPEKKYYLPLLENYYLYKKENPQVAAFYYLIVCTQFAETKCWDMFLENYKQLEKLKSDGIVKNNFLEMRWLGIQLYYDTQFNNNKSKAILKEAILKHNCINEKDAGHRVSSIYIICHYLFNSNDFETIITLYENSNKYSNILGYWAELNFNQLKIYYVFALLQTNKTERALTIFNQIDVTKFDLNFKKKATIIYKKIQKIVQL